MDWVLLRVFFFSKKFVDVFIENFCFYGMFWGTFKILTFFGTFLKILKFILLPPSPTSHHPPLLPTRHHLTVVAPPSLSYRPPFSFLSLLSPRPSPSSQKKPPLSAFFPLSLFLLSPGEKEKWRSKVGGFFPIWTKKMMEFFLYFYLVHWGCIVSNLKVCYFRLVFRYTKFVFFFPLKLQSL